MLECLEFRDEKNSLGTESLQYGKFLFSQLEKGQGLTVANSLRRILLYEIPAVGITSVFIRTPNFQKTIENADDQFNQNGKDLLGGPSTPEPPKNSKNEMLEMENLSFPDLASSHHEFSTLPGVKESVLELLSNLKSVVFENVFPYSSVQKGTLLLKANFSAEVQDSFKTEIGEASAKPILEASHKRPSKKEFKEFLIRANQLVLPQELRLISPDQILATLTSEAPETNFELEFTIEKISQIDLTSMSSFSGRAPNRSTRNRRILPIDGTVFPVKKVNYTIEQDSFGKELVFFEVWTNGGLHPRAAVYQSIEKAIHMFQAFQE